MLFLLLFFKWQNNNNEIQIHMYLLEISLKLDHGINKKKENMNQIIGKDWNAQYAVWRKYWTASCIMLANAKWISFLPPQCWCFLNNSTSVSFLLLHSSYTAFTWVHQLKNDIRYFWSVYTMCNIHDIRFYVISCFIAAVHCHSFAFSSG